MKPNQADAAVAGRQEHVVPDLDRLVGLEQFLVLIDAENNTWITVAICDNSQSMLKQEQSGWLREKLSKMIPLMAGQPSIEYFGVPINHPASGR